LDVAQKKKEKRMGTGKINQEKVKNRGSGGGMVVGTQDGTRPSGEKTNILEL